MCSVLLERGFACIPVCFMVELVTKLKIGTVFDYCGLVTVGVVNAPQRIADTSFSYHGTFPSLCESFFWLRVFLQPIPLIVWLNNLQLLTSPGKLPISSR